MLNIIKIIQLVLSIIITLLVLIQSKGTGLSSAFGGAGGFYRTRRGVEKLVFASTIVIGVLLVLNSLALLILA
jgi:preprotein translocase subunit SecG